MKVRSIDHRGLKLLLEHNQTRGIRPDLVNRVRNILTVLMLAVDMDDLKRSAPPGWRVHKLTGDRRHTWSVSVSENWRITFEEEGGYLDALNLEDYH